MKDIQTISADYVQGSFQLLEHAGDRARASLYFARRVGEEAEKENYLMAQWYYRASLSEYKSLFDVLPADLRDINLDKIFNMSPFKKEMDSHPLITVLKKARDLAIHSTKFQGQGRHFHVIRCDSSGQTPISYGAVFFDPVKEDHIKKEDRKYITEEQITWFNKQSQGWPAHLLIQEAIFQTSVPLRNFLFVNCPDLHAEQPTEEI